MKRIEENRGREEGVNRCHITNMNNNKYIHNTIIIIKHQYTPSFFPKLSNKKTNTQSTYTFKVNIQKH